MALTYLPNIDLTVSQEFLNIRLGTGSVSITETVGGTDPQMIFSWGTFLRKKMWLAGAGVKLLSGLFNKTTKVFY